MRAAHLWTARKGISLHYPVIHLPYGLRVSLPFDFGMKNTPR